MMQSLLLLGTKPVNPLEEALLAFLKGKTGIEPFLATLIDSRVFILVKGSGDQLPEHIQPLVLDGNEGRPAVCIFTSPERARAIRKRVPEYSTGMEIEFRPFVRSVPATLGMLVNVGTFFSTEADSVGVDELRGFQ